jgi:hypothetical protein
MGFGIVFNRIKNVWNGYSREYRAFCAAIQQKNLMSAIHGIYRTVQGVSELSPFDVAPECS